MKYGNKCPIMISSSIQATIDNPYGKSKKAGEDLLINYSKETGAKVMIYRFPNIFGKWCKPNYNSVIATFCYNVANDVPIWVNDSGVTLNLVYIDDVMEELINALEGNENSKGVFCSVPIEYKLNLEKVSDLVLYFKKCRDLLTIPDLSDDFTRKLYSTYLSYLPEEGFSYKLDMHKDDRGSFTEFLRTDGSGQVSVNVTNPGITKGNHWHHTKNEKFLVVSGSAEIKFRKVGSNKIVTYNVSGNKLEVVEIPAGYTHSIKNTGENELITIMWASEVYDSEHPDTYFMGVEYTDDEC